MGSVFHPLVMPWLLEDNFRLLRTKARAIPDPFEQVFFLMLQLPYRQLFDSVNKRLSRLASNIALAKHNLCQLLLIDVFVWAYERSY